MIIGAVLLLAALVLIFWAGYGYGWNAGRGRTMEREELKAQRKIGWVTIPKGHTARDTVPYALRRATTQIDNH